MSDTSHVVELLAIRRLPNSSNGNPRYELLVRAPGGIAQPFKTMSDTNDAYTLGNSGIRPGCWVEVTLTQSGRIRYIRPVATS